MNPLRTILRLFALTLAVYLVLRITFGILYFSWHPFTFYSLLKLSWEGMRMDIAAFLYVNIVFMLWYIFIVPFLPMKWKIKLSVIFFCVLNLPFITINFIDLVYFKYTLRRSTIDILYVFEDSIHSFGSLFRQYWYVLLIYIVVAIVFVYRVNKIIKNKKGYKYKDWKIRYLAPLLFIGVLVICSRYAGRFVAPATAILTHEPVLQPLVNNSTLNILYSFARSATKLERKDYFIEQQLDSIYTIRRQYNQDSTFLQRTPELIGEKRNVVVFVLESLSADFFIPGPEKAKTPFFDSLLQHSTVCVNAYANGHESVQGLTAILGSLPPFTERPFFLSEYSAVPFDGIGTILKKEGYTTNFFHGAEYDHFNFAKLCRIVGLDNYYSKDTYGHSEHDDGSWGIYDEYFFNYFADVTEKEKQPFLSVLFNTSTHPPFAIPSQHKDQFNIPGQRAQLNSVTYLDYCFSRLFERISKQPWFSNTLFVFSADHTLLEPTDMRSYLYNAYHIPLFIYDPRDTTGKVVTRVSQQLDIVPTILNKLYYTKPFMSFGNDFLAPGSASYGFSIVHRSDGYQLIDSSTLTCINDAQLPKTLYQYYYRQDTALTNNLFNDRDPLLDRKKNYIRAIIQRFNNSLLDHRLLIRE